MRIARGCVLVIALLAVAGCGVPEPATSTTSVSSWIPDQGCRVERRTIETANEAHKATYGTYAESLDRLLAEWLEPPLGYQWTYSSTGSEFTLTGPC